ncbi:hypothetical protein AWJ20_2150 [Sugiyamaella lignohabitans]|uniref:ATPase expression protein 2, mitochondrial n=1 Tax=Sugiyamaella lignohabitans TaxID=796027 RepID=A0A167EWX3_9ASCO|nr:uncharacterized protein AWJ20_2150 [Sugiyamaella lignohabitans]ANB14553.1 hypothetical protein AWJ20_2150 [Sugiyamaella lignohabitans]
MITRCSRAGPLLVSSAVARSLKSTASNFLRNETKLMSTSQPFAKDIFIRSEPYREPFDLEGLKSGLVDASMPSDHLETDLDQKFRGDPTSIFKRSEVATAHGRLGSPIIPSVSHSPNVERLGQFIASKDLNSALHTFQKLIDEDENGLSHFTATQCSQLLAMIPLGPIKAPQYWPLAQKIASAIKASGHKLQAHDYARLIECAFKAHDYDSIDQIWNEVQTNLPVSLHSTDLWNKYIMTTCNAYPKFWRQWAGMQVKRNEFRMFKPDETPLAVNDAVRLLGNMLENNIHPNARTYELVILYLCQKGDLADVRSIIWSIWHITTEPNVLRRSRSKYRKQLRPSKDSPLAPTISTLKAVIDGFCMNGKVTEALRLMNRLQKEYRIDISGGSRGGKAIHLWSAVLSWAFITQRPIEGAFTPADTFENVWTIMTEQYGIKPTDEMYRLRGRFFDSNEKYEDLIADIPEILNSGNPHRLEIARRNLQKAVKGIARQGQIDEAVSIVNEWSQALGEFEQVRENLIKYVNTSSTIQRLIAERSPNETNSNTKSSSHDLHDNSIHGETNPFDSNVNKTNSARLDTV